MNWADVRNLDKKNDILFGASFMSPPLCRTKSEHHVEPPSRSAEARTP